MTEAKKLWADKTPAERGTLGNLYIVCADGTMIIKDTDPTEWESEADEWRTYRAMGAVPVTRTQEFLDYTMDVKGPPLDDELLRAILGRDGKAFTAWQEKTRARIRRERLAAGKAEIGLD